MVALGTGRDRRVAGPWRLVTVVLVLAAAPACLGSGGGPAAGSPFAENPVTVRVENQSWNAVHVYVIAGAEESSLGQISGQSSRTFEIPPSMMANLDEFRLVADPIGSRDRHTSGRILVHPGDVVTWTLTQPLTHSYLSVE